MTSVGQVDGILICRFSRYTSVSATDLQPDDQTRFFNLTDQSYYLLVATGPAASGKQTFHLRDVSLFAYNLSYIKT